MGWASALVCALGFLWVANVIVATVLWLVAGDETPWRVLLGASYITLFLAPFALVYAGAIWVILRLIAPRALGPKGQDVAG